MRFVDWMETMFGPDWVVCRNTAKNRARYPGYSILTQKQFSEYLQKYEERIGEHPYKRKPAH